MTLLLAAALVLAQSHPAGSLATAIAVSGDRVFCAEGARLAVRAGDGTLIRSVEIPGMERIRSVAVAPSGRSLAVAGGTIGRSGLVVLLDTGTLQVLTAPEQPLFKDAADAVAFANDGSLVVAGSSDKTALALDSSNLNIRTRFVGHTGAVLGVAVHGNRVVTASLDRTLRIWNAETGEVERTLTQHAGAVHCVAFEPGGGRIASGSEDRTLRLWDVMSGRLVRISRGFDGSVLSVAWGAHGLFAGASDGRVRRVDVETGALTVVGNPAQVWVYALALDAGGAALLSSGRVPFERIEL